MQLSPRVEEEGGGRREGKKFKLLCTFATGQERSARSGSDVLERLVLVVLFKRNGMYWRRHFLL